MADETRTADDSVLCTVCFVYRDQGAPCRNGCDEITCEYSDLDAASGTCRNCGASFWNEPDATLAVERHYQGSGR